MTGIEESIYSALTSASAVTALVSTNNIFPERVPDQTQALPWVMYTLSHTEPVGNIHGETGLLKVEFDVDCLAYDHNTRFSLAEAIRTTLDCYAGNQIQRCFWTGTDPAHYNEGFGASVRFSAICYDSATVTPATGGTAHISAVGNQVRICGELTDCSGNPYETSATVGVGTTTTLSIGSPTTLAAVSSATVTNSGTSSAAVFNFGIPQGAAGGVSSFNTRTW